MDRGDCIGRGVYRINARNLRVGVYDAESFGFIGIRKKFGVRYLDVEYQTARPVARIGTLPEDIACRAQGDTVDRTTRRPLVFDRPVADGGRGWVFSDTNKAAPDAYPVSEDNQALFAYLDAIEAADCQPQE